MFPPFAFTGIPIIHAPPLLSFLYATLFQSYIHIGNKKYIYVA